MAKKRVKKKTVRKKTAQRKKTTTHSKGTKRLYRANKKDSMIGGVCAGIAQYYNMDPVIIRLIAIILALVNGIGILAYLLAWIIIPRK